jgi:hypothetical protein
MRVWHFGPRLCNIQWVPMDVYPVPAAVMQARVQLVVDQTDKAPSATINNDVDDVIQVQAQREALLDVKV